MYLTLAALLLSVTMTMLNAGTAMGQLWVCPLPDGSTLFTDQAKKDGSCTTYEPASRLVYAPPTNWANMPPRDPVPEARKVQKVQKVLPESQIDDSAVGDDTEAYDTPFDSYWEDDLPAYTQFYSAVPFFRHRLHPGLQHKPGRHYRQNSSSASTAPRPQLTGPSPEGAPRTGSEAPRRSSSYIVPPIGQSQSTPSIGMREGSRSADPGASSAPYIVPPIESSRPTSSMGMHEGSMGTAPSQSRESAPYIVPPIGHEGKR
jgi:hypothetical protein